MRRQRGRSSSTQTRARRTGGAHQQELSPGPTRRRQMPLQQFPTPPAASRRSGRRLRRCQRNLLCLLPQQPPTLQQHQPQLQPPLQRYQLHSQNASHGVAFVAPVERPPPLCRHPPHPPCPLHQQLRRWRFRRVGRRCAIPLGPPSIGMQPAGKFHGPTRPGRGRLRRRLRQDHQRHGWARLLATVRSAVLHRPRLTHPPLRSRLRRGRRLRKPSTRPLSWLPPGYRHPSRALASRRRTAASGQAIPRPSRCPPHGRRPTIAARTAAAVGVAASMPRQRATTRWTPRPGRAPAWPRRRPPLQGRLRRQVLSAVGRDRRALVREGRARRCRARARFCG